MAVRPATPWPFAITSWTNNSVNGYSVLTGGDGGSKILQWQIGYGLLPGEPTNYIDISFETISGNVRGTGSIGGLIQGKTYYFWSRVRNAIGWSDFSGRTDVSLRDVPDAPGVAAFDRIEQTSVTVRVQPRYDNGADITNYRLAYGLSSSFGSATQVSMGLKPYIVLENLDPGKTYYFWARVSNKFGDSPWSARKQCTLIAGAWVRVGFTWRRAVPYVRSGGVWKLAQPWVKRGTFWHKTEN